MNQQDSLTKQLLVDAAEHQRLLGLASAYINDLASSLENACEDYEGDEEDDPQAKVEVQEAREFVEQLETHLKKFEVPE